MAESDVPTIDTVFETYDADVSGYLDEEEAREMIKGLQKFADDSRHEACARAQAAVRARREATKITDSLSLSEMSIAAPAASAPLPRLAPKANKAPLRPPPRANVDVDSTPPSALFFEEVKGMTSKRTPRSSPKSSPKSQRATSETSRRSGASPKALRAATAEMQKRLAETLQVV